MSKGLFQHAGLEFEFRLEGRPRPLCAGILLLNRLALADMQVSALGKAIL